MTMSVRTMVCLANSRRHFGRCVAGREIVDGEPGGCIRPVSNQEHEEVPEHVQRYQDGSAPKVLNIISIPLIEPKPKSYQTENWLLESMYFWEKHGRAGWDDLEVMEDPVADLWTNVFSTPKGKPDVSVGAGHAHERSLKPWEKIRMPRSSSKMTG